MISPESQGGPNIGLITIVCGWTFLVIALLGVSLMLWFRRIQHVSFGLDDFLTILALVMAIALVAQTTWAIVDEGQADHEAEVSKKQFALAVRSLLVNETLWGVVNTLVRMCAILFMMMIFGAFRLLRCIARSLLVISILYGVVVLLEIFLICRPMAVDWNASVDGKCGNQILAYLVLEVFGLLLDFTILVVPIPFLWKLSMEWKMKISVTFTFSIGVLVFIVTGLRLQALHMVNAQDFTYSKSYLGLLSAIGASLAVFFCCTPYTFVIYEQIRVRMTVHMDEENIAPNVENPHKISLPIIEDSVTKAHGRSAQRSVDGCAANAKWPPCGGLRRYHTF